uniref:Uncharacterized protein n=1 Tax=Ursus maritimus TaxID=29073 RepID=A0A452UK99_URSMA
MSVPVEQLEISIPQGYSLFIKTIFQARSFTKPLELQFEVQIEYLASFPTSPRPSRTGSSTHHWCGFKPVLPTFVHLVISCYPTALANALNSLV